MSAIASIRARRFYAETYDTAGVTWPGEIPFYLELTTDALKRHRPILDLACGTGRIAIPLSETGLDVTGLDHSPFMLDVARQKSEGVPNIQWVEGDMCAFQLERTFAIILIPGHAFQNLNTVQEQMACLTSIKNHLDENGLLVIHVDHLDLRWLGEISGDKAGMVEVGQEFIHPLNGHTVRTLHAWSYDCATQTATHETIWDVASEREKVEERVESGPTFFHCFFRYEMEHLLHRCGLAVQAVYGDFHRGELTCKSPEMIWIAKRSR